MQRRPCAPPGLLGTASPCAHQDQPRPPTFGVLITTWGVTTTAYTSRHSMEPLLGDVSCKGGGGRRANSTAEMAAKTCQSRVDHLQPREAATPKLGT